MSFAKMLAAPLRYRLWRPHHLRLILADMNGTGRQGVQDHRTHLGAVIDWLCHAQDRRNRRPDQGGVSAGWSFEDGWLPSYPETSGYIVETFLTAAKILERPELTERAGRILDWELAIQNPDGSFPGHFGEPGSQPVIFNTGQIMHGLVAGYLAFGHSRYLDASLRAGRWMLERQDADGCWRRSVHNGVPHTYNTRAAWALLRTGLIADNERLVAAAERNLRWALTQQTDSGWFATNAFTPDRSPFTHTIAYAVRGMLEGGLLLDNEEFVSAAARAAHGLADAQRVDGWLAGTYDDDWKPTASYCCLTGLAQTVIVWERLAKKGVGRDWSAHIERGLRYLKSNHRLKGDGSPEDGGVAGSAPIWGDYSRFEYPNWAAKFFSDALMMNMSDIVVPSEQVARSEQQVA